MSNPNPQPENHEIITNKIKALQRQTWEQIERIEQQLLEFRQKIQNDKKNYDSTDQIE